MPGKVYFVGAGPGDPDLVTVKGLDAIKRADVILADRLVNPKILENAKSEAEIIVNDQEADSQRYDLDTAVALLSEKAREDKMVVRLRNGDPLFFNRGGDEALRLVEVGVKVEIVPGVTSAEAAPAYAGIPVTMREYTTGLTVLSGHGTADRIAAYDWPRLAAGTDTLVFLVSAENMLLITNKLIEHGRESETPAALISFGTLPRQRTVSAGLETVTQGLPKGFTDGPLVLVVGQAVDVREKLNWFETKPLFGKRIMLTRSREQAADPLARLMELGADVIEFPTIKTVPLEDYAELDRAIADFSYDWVVFTSVNGVKYFIERVYEQGKDLRIMGGASLAAVGPGTAMQLARFGLKLDVMPKCYIAEGLLEYFKEIDISGSKVLIPRAKVAREVLPKTLADMGAAVETIPCYETLPDDSKVPEAKQALEEGVDIVTFTSSSTINNFMRLIGHESADQALAKTKVVCIGPATAKTAETIGLKVAAVAQPSTIPGLVDTILKL